VWAEDSNGCWSVDIRFSFVSCSLSAKFFTAGLLVQETGGDVWLGGYALARYLNQHVELVAQKSVLELGSGTGYLSLFLAMRGAARVIAT
jgi:protein-L-isoaspartate O-methyltransferase